MMQPLPTYLFVLPWGLGHAGGVNQVVINLARQMQGGQAFRPLVLVADWACPTMVKERQQDLPVVRWRIRPPESIQGWSGQLTFQVWKLGFGRRLARFLAENKVAAVNVHYPGGAALTLVRTLRHVAPGLPLVVSFHGADLTAIESSPADLAAWRSVLGGRAWSVGCSQAMTARITAAMGSGIQARTVHNGLDLDRFLDAPPAGGGPPVDAYILSVARFERKKGLDVLLAAFERLAPAHPALHLVLVGAKDDQLGPLQEQAARAGLAPRVHFFGDVPHEQVAGFFRRARVFVLPSRQEPFGIVLLEAGAYGIPVVASATGGIPEIVTDGVTGRLCAPEDDAALAQCLDDVLGQPEHARAMGAALHERVRATFTWESACRQYAALVGAGPQPAAAGTAFETREKRSL